MSFSVRVRAESIGAARFTNVVCVVSSAGHAPPSPLGPDELPEPDDPADESSPLGPELAPDDVPELLYWMPLDPPELPLLEPEVEPEELDPPPPEEPLSPPPTGAPVAQ
jgi:hypothetical protein